MHITIIADGSRGDVQPYVALGRGLKEAGHTVQLLCNETFAGLVTSYGLDFVPTGTSTDAQAQQTIRTMAEQGKLLQMLTATGRGAQQLAIQSARHALPACRATEIIIGGLGALPMGYALAQKVGVPFVQAYLMPLTATHAFPSALTPIPQVPLMRWANRLTHRLTQKIIWGMFRNADAQVRSAMLQLPSAPAGGPFSTHQLPDVPVIYGYSPHVVPRPSDWPAHIHVTGYWFLDEPDQWQPPAELCAFLAAGPPPVYIGFGSMGSSSPRATTELAVRALELAGQRGVLFCGEDAMARSMLPRTIYMTDAVPHSWLFSQMAAVVHHGGAGTTAAGLRAGVPSIITPFFGDQPFWGRRVRDLGVGPRPIPRRALTAEKLAVAIHQAVADPVLQQRAATLGAHIRAEDGVHHAVHVLNAVMLSRSAF